MTYPPNIRLLALDLATVTGWAILASGVVTSGAVSFARRPATQHRPAPHVGHTHALFEDWLRGQFNGPRFDGVIYEDAGFFKSAAAVQVCVGLRGILLARAATAYAMGVPLFTYSPSTVKKHWTGSGNAKKPAMMAETRRRFPDLDLTDSNEADALALLDLHVYRNYVTLRP